MSHFEYEKPSAVEISERELSEIAAVLYSSGGGTVPIPETFDEYVTNAAGFPDDTAGSMLSLLATLIDRQFGGKTAAYRAWLFFRVIGGFQYGGTKWMNMAWEAFSGPLSYDQSLTGSDDIPVQEENFFVSTLGMSKSNYRALRFYVRLQHALCSKKDYARKDGNDNPTDKFTSAMKDSRQTYFRVFSGVSGLPRPGHPGEVLSDATYEGFYGKCFDEMTGRCDFSHMCITIASILAEDAGFSFSGTNSAVGSLYPGLCSQISKNKARKAFAGWLGDACLIDPGDKATSMWDDDYSSDMDALIITSKCRSNGFDYRAAIKECYSSSSRRSHFLNSYMTLSKAVTCMRLGSGSLSGMTDSQWLSYIASDTMYQDTYRFYRILKGEISEPSA